MGNTRKDKAKIMFATHPKVDEFYVTSNDKFFYTEQDAESAAQLLEDKKVVKLERDTVPANEELEKEIEANKAAGQSTAENADAPNNPDGSQGEGDDDSSDHSEESPEPEKTEGVNTDQADDQSGNEKDVQADQSDVESLDSLKDEYKELTGNAAHHTWDAAKIEEKIAEAKAKASEGK